MYLYQSHTEEIITQRETIGKILKSLFVPAPGQVEFAARDRRTHMIYGVQGGRRLDRFLDRFLAEIRRFWGPRGRVWTPRGLILGPGEARAPLLGAGGGSGTSPDAIFRGLCHFCCQKLGQEASLGSVWGAFGDPFGAILASF